ncbi:hypothetical protein G6011_01525 [Alternaria panax]|uniref:Uncharacterized protein n=1 Tax=Alternaria panax TaxID=48097 RepID=A0AAD4NVZ4_9PLEO|nr:hypothetical protein G6011_01525 [Alternaria panax]
MVNGITSCPLAYKSIYKNPFAVLDGSRLIDIDPGLVPPPAFQIPDAHLKSVCFTSGHRKYVFDAIQAIIDHPEDDLYTFATEGMPNTRKGLQAVPTELALVRCCSDRDKSYSGFIAYSEASDRATFIRALEDGHAFRNGRGNLRVAPYYPELGAKTIDEHGQALRDDSGFDESGSMVVHRGGGKLDISTIGRLVRGENNIVVTVRDDTELNCVFINLLKVYRLCYGPDGLPM